MDIYWSWCYRKYLVQNLVYFEKIADSRKKVDSFRPTLYTNLEVTTK